MKSKAKRAMALALAAVVTIAASGCGKKVAKEIELGTGEMPKELTVFAPISALATKAGATDKNDILAFQLAEEATGCHINWINPSEVAFEEQFKLLLASGNYPDIIHYFWDTVPGGMQQYVDDGVIIPITDLLEFMPNFKKFGEENPEIKKQYSVGGEIFHVPVLRGDNELRVFLGPEIRQDWLDKLGLEMPTTTDELYDVLKAFKTQDPNGNGKNDEIPFTGMLGDSITFGVANLVWAFDTHYDFYVKDGKITHGMLEDNMKDALRYLNKLYEEELLDVDYLINDQEKYDNKIMNDRAGFFFGIQPSKYYNNMNDGTKLVKAVPYIGGKCFNPIYLSNLCSQGAAITTACKNPSGAAAWLDFFFSEKGVEISNFGREGFTYNVENGKRVLDNEYIFNNPDGIERKDICAKSFISATTDFPTIQTWEYYSQTLEKWGRDAIVDWYNSADTTGALPPITFTNEEKDVMGKISSDITTYVSEVINNMIIGRTDISEFDNVKKKLREMGMDELIKIYNDAYERYNK